MVTVIQIITIFYDLAEEVLSLYWWAIVIAAVVSNLVAFGIVDTRNRLVWTIADFLNRITEPALRRIRRVLPSFGGIDLSPLALLLGVSVIQRLLTVLVQALIAALV